MIKPNKPKTNAIIKPLINKPTTAATGPDLRINATTLTINAMGGVATTAILVASPPRAVRGVPDPPHPGWMSVANIIANGAMSDK